MARRRLFSTPIAVLALAHCVAAPPATAESADSAGTAPPAFATFAGITWTSDYRFNGVSVRNGRPAMQGFLHMLGPNGWYGGVFASQVDFDDPGNTSGEFDTYVGRTIAIGRSEARLEAMYLAFDEDVPGPTYDFWQAKAVLRRTFERITLAGNITWTPEAPYGGGRQIQIVGEGEWVLDGGWSLMARLGHASIDLGEDRNYWDLGVEWRYGHLKAGVRWADTDVPDGRCLAEGGCDGAVIATLTLQSWSVGPP